MDWRCIAAERSRKRGKKKVLRLSDWKRGVDEWIEGWGGRGVCRLGGGGGAKRWDDGGWTIEMLRRTLLDRARGSLTLLFSVTVPLILIPSPPFPFLLLPIGLAMDLLKRGRRRRRKTERTKLSGIEGGKARRPTGWKK